MDKEELNKKRENLMLEIRAMEKEIALLACYFYDSLSKKEARKRPELKYLLWQQVDDFQSTLKEMEKLDDITSKRILNESFKH